ncbi:hypothetical protein [Apilactobacillus xinyiensis]|uniref:hypothetical protein n=1 Tax=Apilactobacillus xinyiensis TaxID=2841032 RepID=UPI001C7CC0E5|nr:hypothetical protein [Apilactobacillus xinyiensis]
MQKCDLYRHWEKFCQKIAENELEIHNPSVVKYLVYKSKCIEFPVKVKISDEIYKRKEYLTVIKDIKNSLERGRGLSMYLSKRAKKLKSDGMFNDFGILHLHLNKMIGNNIIDIAKDSGTTLQVYYHKGVVYVFNFGRHGKGAYTNINDVQKLYDVFPNSLKSRILNLKEKRSSNLNNISSEDRYKLRQLNISTTTEIKDVNSFAISLAPAMFDSLKDDNLTAFKLQNNLNESFIKLQNFLYKRGHTNVKLSFDLNTKDLKIVNPRNNSLIYSINNDDLINELIY